MDNFCALPFHHLDIRTNGNYSVCCVHHVPTEKILNINHHDHDDWFKSDYLQEVRDSFKKNQRHPGCRQCWEREDAGFPSLRQRTEKEYRILGIDTSVPMIKNVEVDLGNLCNLKCLMCNENNSSAILAENTRLNINKKTQNDFKWGDNALHNLEKILNQSPRVVNIRGGEPFYNNKLLEIIQNINEDRARPIVLHITTNATVWNEEWKQALSKFRLVRIMLSIDAIGDLYEYMRYPANWNEVEKNISDMCQMPNFKLLVHCSVQNLNITHLGDVVEWCDQRNLYLDLENVIIPHYFKIENLPESQKKQAIDNLKKLNLEKYPDHVSKFIISSIELLSSTEFEPNMWKEFCYNISMRDRLRGNSYQTFIKA